MKILIKKTDDRINRINVKRELRMKQTNEYAENRRQSINNKRRSIGESGASSPHFCSCTSRAVISLAGRSCFIMYKGLGNIYLISYFHRGHAHGFDQNGP